MANLAVTNIGIIVSGDYDQPLLAGSTVIVQDGVIAAIGDASLLEAYPGFPRINANGAALVPGLIDSHCHPTIGDFTPRQRCLDYIDSSLHGGVTTVISAGEPHVAGRPKDPVGVKAQAIFASRTFANARPSGVKVHGGAVILEKGLTEQDFAELAREGVHIVGEIGLGSVKDPAEAAVMAGWAKKYGFQVQMHTGGTSIPGSSTVTAQDVITVAPTVVSHLNGGPTAIPPAEIDILIDETDFTLEIVQCGNIKVADYAMRQIMAKGQGRRVIIGNDSPSGIGITPMGVIRTVSQIASLSEIPAELVLAMATGNTARVYGLNCGLIQVGREADLVIMDAPMGSVGADLLSALAAGDVGAVSMVIIDGEVRVKKSRNTPPPKHSAQLLD